MRKPEQNRQMDTKGAPSRSAQDVKQVDRSRPLPLQNICNALGEQRRGKVGGVRASRDRSPQFNTSGVICKKTCK